MKITSKQMIKFFLKKISKKIINKQDAFKSKLYCRINNNKNLLILCDIGGADGLETRWKFFDKYIRTFFFEPDKRSSINLRSKGYEVIEQALWSETKKKQFYLTKKPEVSSFYNPNRSYIDLYSDSERYNIVKVIDMEVSKLDNFINNQNQPHFIKLDTQGSELEILKGSKDTLKNVLGLEVEVNFKPIYKNIPLVCDVENFLNDQDFVLNDFITYNRWERSAYRGFGEINHADALFLKTPEKIIEISEFFSDPMFLFENYVKILFIYNKLDLIVKLSEIISYEHKKALNLNLIIEYLEKNHKRLLSLHKLTDYYTRYLISKDIKFPHWNL